MGANRFECMTEGCERWARAWITFEGRNKHVCLSCRDELTSIFGWLILPWGSG